MTQLQSESFLQPTDALSTLSRAARDGAADAREMATRVWAGTNLFLCRFTYTTTYTIAYGVVFPATLISRSIPRDNAAVRGLIAGAKAATERARGITGTPYEIPDVV